MKFFEQFSLGDRVEVDAPTGGMTNFELGIMGGARGTVLDKRKGNWLDPVTQYVVEMDYPCEQVKVEISGRFLKNLPPTDEQPLTHKNFPVGTLVATHVYESLPSGKEQMAAGILLPATGPETKYKEVIGTVAEHRKGARRNEPDRYFVKWESGDSDWHSESSLRTPSEHGSGADNRSAY
jgi:hypothetical protein